MEQSQTHVRPSLHKLQCHFLRRDVVVGQQHPPMGATPQVANLQTVRWRGNERRPFCLFFCRGRAPPSAVDHKPSVRAIGASHRPADIAHGREAKTLRHQPAEGLHSC
jgi:hypothetical protein